MESTRWVFGTAAVAPGMRVPPGLRSRGISEREWDGLVEAASTCASLPSTPGLCIQVGPTDSADDTGAVEVPVLGLPEAVIPRPLASMGPGPEEPETDCLGDSGVGSLGRLSAFSLPNQAAAAGTRRDTASTESIHARLQLQEDIISYLHRELAVRDRQLDERDREIAVLQALLGGHARSPPHATTHRLAPHGGGIVSQPTSPRPERSSQRTFSAPEPPGIDE